MSGYATKEWDTQLIQQDDVVPTIKYISRITGIPIEDLHPVGSTGKMYVSGDIDLAIDERYSSAHIRDALKRNNISGVRNAGTNVDSYPIPICGDTERGLVQVDFMFTSSPEWAKFAYYTGEMDSHYKGAVRTILLQAIATSINDPDIDYFEYDKDGQLMIRMGRVFDLNTGLRRIFQYRPERKDGKGYLKRMQSISCEEYREMFPDSWTLPTTASTSNDPQTALNIMFGHPNVKVKDVETAEQVLELIEKFDLRRQTRTMDYARLRAKELKGKIQLPPDLL